MAARLQDEARVITRYLFVLKDAKAADAKDLAPHAEHLAQQSPTWQDMPPAPPLPQQAPEAVRQAAPAPAGGSKALLETRQLC